MEGEAATEGGSAPAAIPVTASTPATSFRATGGRWLVRGSHLLFHIESSKTKPWYKVLNPFLGSNVRTLTYAARSRTYGESCVHVTVQARVGGIAPVSQPQLTTSWFPGWWGETSRVPCVLAELSRENDSLVANL